MNDLLLRLRIETLQSNFDATSRHMSETSSPLTSIATLKTKVEKAAKDIAAVRLACIKVKSDPKSLDFLAVDAIDKRASRASTSLSEVANELEMLQQRFFQNQNGQMAKDLASGLTDETNRIKEVLEQINQAIGKDPISPATWRQFREDTLAPSRDLFEHCIDLLGGIAIRDMRLNGAIWQIADELVRSYRPLATGSPTRAIPSRLERPQPSTKQISRTLARIVRLGFPEWTSWALPLTAHEFWHVNADNALKHHLLSRLERDHLPLPDGGLLTAENFSRYEVCAADVFATYVMGPAYACAAIGLVLDPSQTSGIHVADDVRAETIFSTLHNLDEIYGKLDSPFVPITKVLGEAWRAAKTQHFSASATVADDVTEIDKSIARRISELLVNVLYNHHYTFLTKTAWQEVMQWRGTLSVGAGAWPVGKTPNLTEIRQLLNAAWLARLLPGRDPSIDLDDRTLQIAADRFGSAVPKALRGNRLRSAGRGLG